MMRIFFYCGFIAISTMQCANAQGEISNHFDNIPKWTDKVGAIVGIVSCVLAIVGSIVAITSYRQRTTEILIRNSEIALQNKLNRFKNYLIINKSFEENESILCLRNAAERNDWSKATKDNRYDFMSFYEQMALMLQSGLISEDVAFYVYGYELIRAFENPEFWINNDPKDDKFWELFRSMYNHMKIYSKKYLVKPFPVDIFTF